MTALQHTQQQFILSVNVITTDDNGLHLAVLPLLSLSWLVMLFWRFRQAVYQVGFWLKQAHSALWCVSEAITERLTIAAKVLTIGFNSLAWGML